MRHTCRMSWNRWRKIRLSEVGITEKLMVVAPVSRSLQVFSDCGHYSEGLPWHLYWLAMHLTCDHLHDQTSLNMLSPLSSISTTLLFLALAFISHLCLFLWVSQHVCAVIIFSPTDKDLHCSILVILKSWQFETALYHAEELSNCHHLHTPYVVWLSSVEHKRIFFFKWGF